MPRAWYMDNSDCDQREPHLSAVNPEFVSLEKLAAIGVLYWKVWVHAWASIVMLSCY